MKKYAICLLLFLSQVYIFSQSIENVRFEQRGDQIIIYYDLVSDDLKGSFSINAFYTLDQGNNYIMLKSLTGDAGTNITPGRQKRIVWNVLDDVYELTGEIKFKVTAEEKKGYTFWDYDLFLSIRTVKDYWPFGGRVGLLGPGRIGGYGSFVYGINYTLEADKYVVAGGPIVNIVTKEKTTLSIFAGAGYYDEFFYNTEDLYDDFYDYYSGFLGEGGFILNLNHINISLALELSDEIYAFAGIGFTL